LIYYYDRIKIKIMNKLVLLKKMKSSLVARFGGDIREIILFGFQVNGTAVKDSDYDVLIVLNRDYDWRFKNSIVSAIYELELENDVFIDTKIISTHELYYSLKGKHPLCTDAIRDGIRA